MIDTINKDVFLKPKGHVKVELFNAETGRREGIQEGNNIITDYGLWRLRKYFLLSLVQQFGVQMSYHDSDQTNDIYSSVNSADMGFMKYLYLTDSDETPVASDVALDGVVTGFASRVAYTGTDVLRGQYTKNESIATNAYLKTVFDFATDRANGTHKSVMWTDRLHTDKPNFRFFEEDDVICPKTLLRAYYKIVYADDGYLWGVIGTTLYKIDPADGSEIATYTLPGSVSGTSSSIFDVVNGIVYYTTTSSNTTLRIFTIATSTEVTKTLAAASGMYGGAVKDGYLYYPYSTGAVHRYNIDSWVRETLTLPIVEGVFAIMRGGTKLYIVPNSNTYNCYELDWVLGTQTLIPNSDCLILAGYGNTNTDGKLLNINGKQRYYGSTAETFYPARYIDMSKMGGEVLFRKLLDTPITKLNTQTMKITYTITF